MLGAPEPQPHPIQHQALYHPAGYPFAVIASPMGAPMAVMLLEQLIALGARRLLYLGFCGALVPSYRIGDLFLPVQAIREEGTSYHYLPADIVPCASPMCRPYSTLRHSDGGCPSSKGPSGRLTHRTAKHHSRFSSFKRLGCMQWTWKWPPYSLWATIVSARWERCWWCRMSATTRSGNRGSAPHASARPAMQRSLSRWQLRVSR